MDEHPHDEPGEAPTGSSVGDFISRNAKGWRGVTFMERAAVITEFDASLRHMANEIVRLRADKAALQGELDRLKGASAEVADVGRSS